jgi:hypothetical protein
MIVVVDESHLDIVRLRSLSLTGSLLSVGKSLLVRQEGERWIARCGEIVDES